MESRNVDVAIIGAGSAGMRVYREVSGVFHEVFLQVFYQNILWRRALQRDGKSIRGATRKNLSALAALSMLLSACAVGPDFERPEAETADGWLDSDDQRLMGRSASYEDWWRAFNDSTLNSLVERARAQNLSLQITAVRVLEARAQLGISKGLQFPQLQQLSGQTNVTEVSDNAANAAFGDDSFYNAQLNFDAAWELDLWGRFRRGVESAEANVLGAIADYQDFLVIISAEVARTYILMRTFEERLALARNNVDIQSRSYEIADVRFRNGAVTELDATQALALLKDTQALIPQLETGLRQARNALSVLLGLPPGELSELLSASNKIPNLPAELAVGIPADLLRRRPDIRRAELQAAAQSARIGVAKADFFPRVSLIGTIGLQASDSGGLASNNSNIGDLFNANSLTYFFGPSVEWPILNYGRIKSNVRVQDARFQQLVVNYQNVVLEAAREVEDNLIAYLRGQSRVTFLSESVDASERSVDVSLVQYRAGDVDYQRVLESQRFLVQQQDRLTAARGDVALSLVATYKALGGGWETASEQEPVKSEIQASMRERTDWGNLLPR